MKQVITVIILATICFLVLIFGVKCLDILILKNQFKEIEIGDTYLKSFYWDSEDPFEDLNIDTVKVIDIKDGYVKYSFNCGDTPIYGSAEIKYFRDMIRDLDYKH